MISSQMCTPCPVISHRFLTSGKWTADIPNTHRAHPQFFIHGVYVYLMKWRVKNIVATAETLGYSGTFPFAYFPTAWKQMSDVSRSLSKKKFVLLGSAGNFLRADPSNTPQPSALLHSFTRSFIYQRSMPSPLETSRKTTLPHRTEP